MQTRGRPPKKTGAPRYANRLRELRHRLGLSQQEIAEALGVRRGTVSATVSQSLARMREGGAKRA